MKIPRYKLYLAALDFITVLLSIYAAKYIAFLENPSTIYVGVWNNLLFGLFFVLISFTFLFIFQYYGLYKLNTFIKRAFQFISFSRALFLGVIVIISLSFIAKIPGIRDSRLFIILFTINLIILFIFLRAVLFRNLFLKFAKSRYFRRKLIIVGAGKAGKLLGAKLFFENNYGTKLIGYIDDNIPVGTKVLNDFKVLGPTTNLLEISARQKISEVIIAIDNIEYERLLNIIDLCIKASLDVKLASELFDIVPQKIITDSYSGIPIVDVSPRINQNITLLFKRVIDFIGVMIGLILLSPVLLLIAVLVKTTSKGPVLFKQKRIGLNGKEFLFFKFRSMTIINEDDSERQKQMILFMKDKHTNGETKVINEARITWIGKYIRKLSLDELPQLLNVLRGEMSLVGPRPCLPYEYENYDEWQKRRLKVLPGCTGVWQVSGRSNVSFTDSVVLDLYYINNMSPWLDLQLILKTFPVMIFGKGGK